MNTEFIKSELDKLGVPVTLYTSPAGPALRMADGTDGTLWNALLPISNDDDLSFVMFVYQTYKDIQRKLEKKSMQEWKLDAHMTGEDADHIGIAIRSIIHTPVKMLGNSIDLGIVTIEKLRQAGYSLIRSRTAEQERLYRDNLEVAARNMAIAISEWNRAKEERENWKFKAIGELPPENLLNNAQLANKWLSDSLEKYNQIMEQRGANGSSSKR